MEAVRPSWAALRREAERIAGDTPIPYALTEKGKAHAR
jgi:hypothetical protein